MRSNAVKKKKRLNGEGAFYQCNTTGYYQYSWTVGRKPDGTRIRKTISSKTKSALEKRIKELKLKDRASGNENMLLSDLLDDWLDNKIEGTGDRKPIRPTTERLYRSIIDKHIKSDYGLGGWKLKSVNDAWVVDDFYKRLKAHGVSARVREICHIILKSSFNRAVKKKWMAFNPCILADKPRYDEKSIRVFSVKEREKFLKACKDTPFEALYMLALFAGLRQGELFGLKWTDINFSKRTLKVERQVVEIGKKLFEAEPKSKNGIRTIQLSNRCVEALREHQEKMRAKSINSFLVFCDSKGTHLRKSNFLSRSFKPLLKKAGLDNICREGEKLTFHSLRHHCGTYLAELGVDAKAISRRLGHANEAFTSRRYIHYTDTMAEDTARRIDEAEAERKKGSQK